MNRKPKIFVVDDDSAIIELIQSALEPLDLELQVFKAAEPFLETLQPADFGCLLLDLSLPQMSGEQLQQRLVDIGAEMKVVIVTGTADVPAAVQVFRAGAVDMIQKPFDRETVLQAVRKALDLVQTTRLQRLHRSAARQRVSKLTPREHEVMQLLCEGKANKQVAADLGLSVRTVEVHRAHIMKKLEVESFAEVMQLWIQTNGHLPA